MRKRTLKFLICIFAGLTALVCFATAAINIGMYSAGSRRISLSEEAIDFPDAQCILVLGCQVKSDGTPSHMLEDRLKRGVALWQAGAAPKLLMSGDHGRDGYNEVGTMKQYAINAGVPSQDVFMDHAGFSTYESLYRAKHIFGVERLIIVTQKYHLYRALHIANALGLEAWGVASDYRSYSGQSIREIREILARVKDFAVSVLQPKPTYLGEIIPITEDGNTTNDLHFVFTLPSTHATEPPAMEQGPLELPTPAL